MAHGVAATPSFFSFFYLEPMMPPSLADLSCPLLRTCETSAGDRQGDGGREREIVQTREDVACAVSCAAMCRKRQQDGKMIGKRPPSIRSSLFSKSSLAASDIRGGWVGGTEEKGSFVWTVDLIIRPPFLLPIAATETRIR